MPHHASWHLMRMRPDAARRRSMTPIGREAACSERDFDRISSQVRASLPCVPITASEVINAMWRNAASGSDEPPEPEQAGQPVRPKPPLRPSSEALATHLGLLDTTPHHLIPSKAR